jgi:hypothetical protein
MHFLNCTDFKTAADPNPGRDLGGVDKAATLSTPSGMRPGLGYDVFVRLRQVLSSITKASLVSFSPPELYHLTYFLENHRTQWIWNLMVCKDSVVMQP